MPGNLPGRGERMKKHLAGKAKYPGKTFGQVVKKPSKNKTPSKGKTK